MKILLIHSDFIEWEPKKKAIKSAEEVTKKPLKVNNALVVFTAVERGDEKVNVVENSVKEILKVFRKVKAKNIVLYPYAHLSSSLSSPSVAIEQMKKMEKMLNKEKIPIKRAPFGWYKSFKISCKGHPLSELSREITASEEKKESEALKKERKLRSEWYIMEPNGKMNKIEIKDKKISGFDFKGHENLEKFARYEMAKRRTVDKEPPHISLMKKLGIANYEPGSDPGHLRYLPKGKLVKALIEEWVTKKMIENGAMEVETPIMYDYEHPSLKKYLNRFPARQYTIKTPNKNVFLRFSACFGQFLILHDANLSYRNLPLWIYEMTKYSFRVEQRGELSGLRRLRAFTMPDCHAICKDIEQAKSELFRRMKVAIETQEGLGLEKKDFEFALRIVKNFYEKNRAYIKKIAKEWGKPLLVEMWDKRFFYFVLKYEFNFVDALNKAAALTTDQIDVENAERYGIQYMDKDNKKKYPIILHMSPSGAVERVIYALLERAYMEQNKGKNPVFPFWLSPTQIRICSVNDSFNKYCEEIAGKLEKEKIRVDIDDRIESINKKIRDSEMEWIPITIVVGEKERKTGKLAVRFRETGNVETLSVNEVIKFAKKRNKGKPFRPLPLAKMISKRPVFV